MTPQNRPLGCDQKLALDHLARLNAGRWTPSCGWTVKGVAYTVRVLESLVRRDYVVREALMKYAITAAGYESMGWSICGDCGRLTRRPYLGNALHTDRIKRCERCYELTSIGLCERCDGECNDLLPGPRISAYHLMVSRSCLTAMVHEANAAWADAPIHVGCPR